MEELIQRSRTEQELENVWPGSAKPEESRNSRIGDRDTMGLIRRGWERFRDYCYFIQDKKWFSNLTMAMIICNAIVLAIVW